MLKWRISEIAGKSLENACADAAVGGSLSLLQ
jgi:hypothetical protein